MRKLYVLLVALVMMAGIAKAQDNYEDLSPNMLRDSLAHATDILAYHPDSIDLRLKKAAWNIQLRQWEYAKDELDKVLCQENTNIAGLFYRAYVNERLRRYSFARLDYQNLLVLVPGNFEAQLGLALLNEKDKHYTEAYDGINSLVEQYPDRAEGYAARGGMEKGRGMLELAAMDFAEAIKLDETNIDYLLNRADVLITLGEYTEAKEDLERLKQLGIQHTAIKYLYDRMYQ